MVRLRLSLPDTPRGARVTLLVTRAHCLVKTNPLFLGLGKAALPPAQGIVKKRHFQG